MPIRAPVLMTQDAITIGRRALFSSRSEIMPERGGASKYPKGRSTVSRTVDSMDSPPASK